MKKLIGAVALAVYICVAATAFAQAKPKHFDLSLLRPIYDRKTTDSATMTASVNKLVGYLRDEITTPSTPELGMGGGPISSDYIKGVITIVMAQSIPHKYIMATYRAEKDWQIKDLMGLAILGQGDESELNNVVAKLMTTTDNCYRTIAVGAMQRSKNPAVRPVLMKMQLDTLSRVVFQDAGGYKVFKVYPIRQQATEALKRQGVDVTGWVTRVELGTKSRPAALASILEDKNPDQCVVVLQTLEGLGDKESLEIVRKFKASSATEPFLKAANQEAQRILGKHSD